MASAGYYDQRYEERPAVFQQRDGILQRVLPHEGPSLMPGSASSSPDLRPLQHGLKQLDPASSSSQQLPLPLAETQPDNRPALSRPSSPSDDRTAYRDLPQGTSDRWAEALQAKQAVVNQFNHLDEANSPRIVGSEPAMPDSLPTSPIGPSGLSTREGARDNLEQVAAGMHHLPDASQVATSSGEMYTTHEEQAAPTVPNIPPATDSSCGRPGVPVVGSEHGHHDPPHAWRTGSPSVASDVSSQMGHLDLLSVAEPDQLADEELTHFDIPMQSEHPAVPPSAEPLSGRGTSGIQPSAEVLPDQQSAALASAQLQSSAADDRQGFGGSIDRSDPINTPNSPSATRLLVEDPLSIDIHQQAVGHAQSSSSQDQGQELYQKLLQTLRGEAPADAIMLCHRWSESELAEVFAQDVEDEIMLLLANAFKVWQGHMALGLRDVDLP